MSEIRVEQATKRPAIAGAQPKGQIEEMATAVHAAAKAFFDALSTKIDQMSAKLLGLENGKIESKRRSYEELHPYIMPEQAKPLLGKKVKLHPQTRLIMLAKEGMDGDSVELHLRQLDMNKNQYEGLDLVNKNLNETEKTAKSSTTSGTASGLIQLAPLLAGQVLKHIATPFTGNGSLLGKFGVPDLNDRVALDDATKLVRQVLQGPASIFQNLAQNKGMMLGGLTFYYQSQAQNRVQEGQDASAVRREIRQEIGRLAEEVKRILDAFFQQGQRALQQTP